MKYEESAKMFNFAVMKKYGIITLFAVLFALIFGCKTDFDVNASWKDITVVYGLLNQNDSVHYIKVNKAFLGDGNALIMAQNPDSSSYGNNLDVQVEEWRNGSLYHIFYLDTTSIFNKEAGVFYYPRQVMYKFNSWLNESSEYHLIVKNKLTGKLITSSTTLVHDFSIQYPASGSQFIGFTSTTPTTFKWTSAKNGKRYEVIIRFNYTETDIQSLQITTKQIDWNMGMQKSNSIQGGEALEVSYVGDQFYKFLQTKISPNESVTRKAGRVEVLFLVGADDFSTYIDVTSPSTSIVQERPEYTNINNGIGIFSSRYDNTKFSPRSFWLSTRSIDSLVHGQYTSDLGFQY